MSEELEQIDYLINQADGLTKRFHDTYIVVIKQPNVASPDKLKLDVIQYKPNKHPFGDSIIVDNTTKGRKTLNSVMNIITICLDE